MKKIIHLPLFMLLFSCASTKSYIQVFDVQSEDGISKNENALKYSDDYVTIYYNFWKEKGEAGYKFLNKTNEIIYLNLGKSFFILNDIAFDYYKERTYSVSVGNSASESLSGISYESNLLGVAGVSSSKAITITTAAPKIISIPPNSAKIITEYNIVNKLYRDCDLFLYPKKSNTSSKNFSENNSPINFKNIISFTIGDSKETNTIINSFYITQVANFYGDDLSSLKYNSLCGERTGGLSRYFNETPPNKFYIRYSSNFSYAKH